MSRLFRELEPITVRRPIAANPNEVWDVISAPGNLEDSHPFCSANPVHTWPGENSHDTIEYYNGRVVDRRFTAWFEHLGYDLEAVDPSGPSASVSWRISGDDAGAALTISLTPRILDRSPPIVRWVPHLAIVRPMMGRYLRAVLKGIECRVTTGEPVVRNQFGAHAWFSPRESPGRPQP